MSPHELPQGFSARPTVREDLEALGPMHAAADLADLGEVEYTIDDVREFWDLPGVVMERDCRVVVREADGAIVAAADLWPRTPTEIEGGFTVHPAHRGGGLEAWLARWCLRRAEEAAADVGAPVELALWLIEGGVGAPELVEEGFEVERRFVRMTIDLEESAPDAGDLPAGVEVRPFDPQAQGRALHAAHEEAFADHFRHHPLTYEEWSKKRFARDAFDPGLWIVAWAGDEVAAYVLAEVPLGTSAGWVSTVGVRPAWRGRGLARHLLVHSFALLHDRGMRRVSLGVDTENATGATRLYERAGMHESAAYVLWTRDVTAG